MGKRGDARALVSFGIGQGKMMRNRVHIGAGLGESNAWFEPPNRMGAHVDAAIEGKKGRPTGRSERRYRAGTP